jgi:hypothetical protein
MSSEEEDKKGEKDLQHKKKRPLNYWLNGLCTPAMEEMFIE